MATATNRIAKAAALIAALYGARRYYRDWGATKAECRMMLSGDTSVANPAVQTTEAVYIDAPASAVWPLLMQLGDRARLARLPRGVTLAVAEAVPEKDLVLSVGKAGGGRKAVWSFHIQPHWEDRVRVLTRARIALRHPGEIFAVELLRPAMTLGTRAVLLGVKRRVERRIPSVRPQQPIAENR
jgi:hypothetical protein